MQTEKVTWGGLNCVIAHDVVGDEKPALAVVLCHGYGAPGTDLVALGEAMLSTAAEVSNLAFVFPAAPLNLAEQGMPGGRAWWHLDLDRLINRRTPEVMARFRQECPEGLPKARERLVALLADAGRYFDLTADRFVLGGFSQGS